MLDSRVLRRRLFLALAVDASLAEEWAARFREALERCAGVHHARRMRLVPAAEWHLTLCFLGMTAVDRIPALARAAAAQLAACERPRVVELSGGVFPQRGTARVLWLGPREDPAALGALARLAGAARSAVEAVLPGSLATGAEEEDAGQPFRAHLTGARVPRAERGPSREAVRAFEGERVACDWRPREALLFESRPGGEGPRYQVLERFPIGTPAIPGQDAAPAQK